MVLICNQNWRSIHKTTILAISISSVIISLFCGIFYLKNAFTNIYLHQDVKLIEQKAIFEDMDFKLLKFDLYEGSNIIADTLEENKDKVEIKLIPINIIIFCHGHIGDPTQIMDMARQLSNNLYTEKTQIYALDFKEYPSASSVDMIRKETKFLVEAAKYLMNKYKKSHRVKLHFLGHSFGGIVSLLALQMHECPSSYIENIITFNSPTHFHPAITSRAFPQLYAQLHNSSLYPNSTKNISYLQITSGTRDLLIKPSLSSIINIPIEHKLHIYTSSMKNIFSDFGHDFLLTSKVFIDQIINYLTTTRGMKYPKDRINWVKYNLMYSRLDKFWSYNERNRIMGVEGQIFKEKAWEAETASFTMKYPSLISSYYLENLRNSHITIYMNVTDYKTKYIDQGEGSYPPLIFLSSIQHKLMEIYVQYYNKSSYSVSDEGLYHMYFPSDMTMFKLHPDILIQAEIIALKIFLHPRNGKIWQKSHKIINNNTLARSWKGPIEYFNESEHKMETYIYDMPKNNRNSDPRRLLENPKRFFPSWVKQLNENFTQTYNFSYLSLITQEQGLFFSKSTNGEELTKIEIRISNPFASDLLPISLKFSCTTNEDSGINNYLRHFLSDRVIINSYLLDKNSVRIDEGIDTYYYGQKEAEIIEIVPSIYNNSDIYIDIFPLDLTNFEYNIKLSHNYGGLFHTLYQRYILQALSLGLALLLIFMQAFQSKEKPRYITNHIYTISAITGIVLVIKGITGEHFWFKLWVIADYLPTNFEEGSLIGYVYIFWNSIGLLFLFLLIGPFIRILWVLNYFTYLRYITLLSHLCWPIRLKYIEYIWKLIATCVENITYYPKWCLKNKLTKLIFLLFISIGQSCIGLVIILFIPLVKDTMKRIKDIKNKKEFKKYYGKNIPKLPNSNKGPKYSSLDRDIEEIGLNTIELNSLQEENNQNKSIISELNTHMQMKTPIIQQNISKYPIFYIYLVLFPLLLNIFKLMAQLKILQLNFIPYYESDFLLFFPYYFAVFFMFTKKRLRMPMKITQRVAMVMGSYYAFIAYDFLYRIQYGISLLFLIFDISVIAIQIKLKFAKK